MISPRVLRDGPRGAAVIIGAVFRAAPDLFQMVFPAHVRARVRIGFDCN
jgi:hypothetical protein